MGSKVPISAIRVISRPKLSSTGVLLLAVPADLGTDFNDPDFFSSSNSSSFSSGNSAFGSFDFTIPSSWRNKS